MKKKCVCEWCKKNFETWPSRGGRFCSNQCRSEFAARQPKFNYYRQDHGGKVNWHCKQCGKAMRTFKSRVRDTCSQSCGKLYAARDLRVTLKCKRCGKTIEVQRHKITLLNRQYCSSECADADHGELLHGSKNPNWRGGTSDQERGPNWIAQSKRARRRDSAICQSCRQPGRSVHHIRPYRLFKGDWQQANQLTNLVTLCAPCHSKIEHGKMPCPTPLST